MNAVFKWLGVFVVLLVVLLIAAVFVLPKVIDPNDYKADLEQVVLDKTGLKMSIDGPVAWSVFPWVGFSVEKVQVSGTNGKSLAELNKAELSVRLLPLLQKQVEMDTVTLDGLVLTLVKDRNGKGNWEATPAEDSGKVKVTVDLDTDDQPAEEKSGGSGIQLNIAELDIKNLAVDYRDLQQGGHYILSDMYLNAGPIRLGEKFNLKSGLNMQAVEQKLALGLQLNGDVTLDLAAKNYELQKFTIKVTPLNTKDPEMVTLNTDMRIQDRNQMMRLDGTFELQQLNARKLMAQLNLPPLETGDPNALQKVSLKGTLHSEGNVASLEPVQLAIDDFQMDGSIQVSDIKRKALVFNLKGNELNLDNYLPGAAEEPAASTEGGAASQSENTSAPSAAAASSGSEDIALIPVDLIRSLNFDGQLRLSQLIAKKLAFSNPELVINAHNGVLQLRKLQAGFYEGAINTSGKVDARREPKLNLEARMNGVDLGALAKVMPQLEQVDGKANFDMNLATNGMTQRQLTKALNGNVGFNVADGVFKGTNFNRLVCEAVAKVRKKDLTRQDWPQESKFTSLGGTVQIQNGVARNRDLKAELSTLHLNGDGDVDLVQQQLDYRLGLVISGNEAPDLDPACRINEKYADISWPVRCKGSLQQAECGIDYDRVAKLAAELAGKEVERKLEEKIQEKLNEKLGEKGAKEIKDALKGFFGK
ncbi:AsmA family protein [Spongorhabdus nitratireducens]